MAIWLILSGPITALVIYATTSAARWPRRLAVGLAALATSLVASLLSSGSIDSESLWPTASLSMAVGLIITFGLVRAAGWRFASEEEVDAEYQMAGKPEIDFSTMLDAVSLLSALALLVASTLFAVDTWVPIDVLSTAFAVLIGIASSAVAAMTSYWLGYPSSDRNQTVWQTLLIVVFFVGAWIGVEFLGSAVLALKQEAAARVVVGDEIQDLTGVWIIWPSGVSVSVVLAMLPSFIAGKRWIRWPWA